MSDETLREVASLLFGAGADDLVAKFKGTPEQQDRKKRAATAGLSAVGATAGAAGLGLAGKNIAHEYRKAPQALGRMKRLGTAVKTDKFAATLLPLEVAGLGGELMATKILHGDAKRVRKSLRFNEDRLRTKYNEAVRNGTAKPNGKVNGKYLQPVPQLSKKRLQKSEPGASDVHIPTTGKLKRMATRQAVKAAAKEAPKLKRGALKVINETPEIGAKVKQKVRKSADLTWEGEFSKVDADKRQVFGWASIVEMNGQPVVDLQGDYIDIDEIEKSAYDYVIKSRKGGEMHRRDGEAPVHVSDMIESFIVTPEKKEKLGLPDSMPTGWWVGYQINDDDAWNLVKSGKRTGFSIHGRGQRTPTEI